MKKMNLGDTRPLEQPSEFSRRESLVRLVSYLNEQLPADTLTFKGGLFLGEYTGKPRYTQDVDASILSHSGYAMVRNALQSFGEQLVEEGVIARYEIKDDVVEGRSGGAKYYDSKDRVALSIDISLHGGTPLDTMVMDTSIAGQLRLTTIEQIVCDKLSVCFTRSRFRRAKDLYDLWLILQSCTPNVAKVRELLAQREAYPLPVEKAPFRDDCIVQMEHAYNKFILRDPYSETEQDKPDFKEVVRATSGFMSKFMRDDT